ncbi:MAG: selenide, water dikinase SelD [bacterium]|nr:selenide, water dikinase SelD [bacterium]
MKTEQLARRHVVLIGLGHTNSHILRMWGMHPIPDADLTCVSDSGSATYSGMLPAVLAGQVPESAMRIDLVRLSASVGARLIVGRVEGIDRAGHRVFIAGRPAIPYDALSVGIGSIPNMSGVSFGSQTEPPASLVTIKPMQTFLQRLEERLRNVIQADEPLKIAIVGSGVAGIEIAFCLGPYLQRCAPQAESVLVRIVSRSQALLTGEALSTQKRVHQELQARGYELRLGQAVAQVEEEQLVLANGEELDANVIIWATGASPPTLLEQLELPVDQHGFLLTDASLRVEDPQGLDRGHPIFAVGDTGTIRDERLPKAGVYAVRQGPVLWNNIKASIAGEALKDYQPQRDFLRLINLGDGRAIGQWRGWAFQGSWVYRLKHYIDSSFMDKFAPQCMFEPGEVMQCRGCGCKLGAGVLEEAIARFDQQADIVKDDAAPIAASRASNLFASTDFFTNPFQDAHLFGRVAAIHAASDLVAMGAQVSDALANVVLPEGDRDAQGLVLGDFLAGAGWQFHRMGAKIIGGHTVTGPRMEAGFTVIGYTTSENTLRKSGLRPGDQLYLTKPLGIGVLLAAHMRAECRFDHYQALLDWMLDDQADIARLAIASGIQAATDITGFGLVGHLLEMLEPASLQAGLELQAIPTLAGATERVVDGIESSLISENLRFAQRVTADAKLQSLPKYRLLFDPQTCGGLLLGVPDNRQSEFFGKIDAAGLARPYFIGKVSSLGSNQQSHIVVQA